MVLSTDAQVCVPIPVYLFHTHTFCCTTHIPGIDGMLISMFLQRGCVDPLCESSSWNLRCVTADGRHVIQLEAESDFHIKLTTFLNFSLLSLSWREWVTVYIRKCKAALANVDPGGFM